MEQLLEQPDVAESTTAHGRSLEEMIFKGSF